MNEVDSLQTELVLSDRYTVLRESLIKQGPSLPELNPDFSQISKYLFLLKKWNGVHDLVTKGSIAEYIETHVLDALAALLVLQSNKPIQAANFRVIDIGSGAGLPGVLWALSGAGFKEVHLVEPREKRVAFLQEVKRSLGLANLFIHKSRLEKALTSTLKADSSIAVLRALKPSLEICEAFSEIAGPGSKLVWLAGKSPEKSIQDECGFNESYPYNLLGEKELSLVVAEFGLK